MKEVRGPEGNPGLHSLASSEDADPRSKREVELGGVGEADGTPGEAESSRGERDQEEPTGRGSRGPEASDSSPVTQEMMRNPGEHVVGQERVVAQLFVGHLPSDTQLPEVMKDLDVPFSVIRVEGVGEPELHLGGKVIWGVDSIRDFVRDRRERK